MTRSLKQVLMASSLEEAEREDELEMDIGDQIVAIAHQCSPWSGTILYLLENDDIVARALGGTFSAADAGWLRSNAPRELRGIVEMRNPAAHSESVSREQVETVRAQVMGVGCEGALVRMAKAKRAGE